MNRLEALLESYRELISDDELLAKQIGHLEAKIQKIRKKQDKIYVDMAILEQEIRQLISVPEAPLDVEPKKEVPPPTEKRSGSISECDGKKRRKIDLAKVRSLRDAGWSYEKIGDELGFSPASIMTALSRAKKLELTEEEKAGCDKLAEELMGGKK